MRYMLLIYSREGTANTDQEKAIALRHREVMNEAKARGIFHGAEPLQPTPTAVTVRRNGDERVLVTDGPFAETKEQLAGYYILDCASLDEAIEAAATFLHAADMPLVYGMSNTTCEAQKECAALADQLGGLLDSHTSL